MKTKNIYWNIDIMNENGDEISSIDKNDLNKISKDIKNGNRSGIIEKTERRRKQNGKKKI